MWRGNALANCQASACGEFSLTALWVETLCVVGKCNWQESGTLADNAEN